MTSAFVTRPRARTRTGFAVLTTALLVAMTGCGSQASDAEIIEALGGVSASSGVGPAALPAAAGPDLTGTTTDTPLAPASAPGAGQPGLADSVSAGGQAPTTKVGSATGRSGGTSTEAPASRAPLQATKSEIKIGALGSWSGLFGAVLAGAPKTLAAWVAYTNAHGGANGHPIRLIVADDQADPATALTLARRMVESDKIIAMVGNINIFGFAQIDKYMREKNVPMIGGDGVDPGWFTSPVAFPATAHTADQIVKALKTFVDKGARKMAIMYCLEVSALCTYMTEYAQKSPEVGKYVVQTYQVSLVAPSYTSQCIRMKDAGIEVLYLLMDTAGAARAAQNCASQGFKPSLMLLGLDATKEMPTIPALSEAYVPGSTFPPAARGVPAIDKYNEVMAVYGPTVGQSGTGALGWTAGELFGLVSRNLSDKPTPAELFQGLWKVRNETLGGLTVPLTFAQGKGAVAKPCVFIWGVENGKFSAPEGAKPFC